MKFLDKFFGPPNKDTFAQMLMDALKQAGDQREVRYNKADFQLTFLKDGQENGLANLHNIYAEFCSIPKTKRKENLGEVTRALLSYMKELPEDFEDAKPDLLPAIRSRAMFEFTRLQAEIRGQEHYETPFVPIGEDLMGCVVHDLREAMRFISNETLGKWGITFYEAMEAARHNLTERSTNYASIGDKVYSVMAGDHYDSSRILHVDFIRNLKVQGDHIAIVPNRGTLLIAGSDDAEGLAILAELAEKALQEPRPMSGIPMRLTADDEWVRWMPEPGHPMEQKFHRLESDTFAGEYADQKGLLDELHKKKQRDIFVATVLAVQNKTTGNTTTCCVWSPVESLLPKTQKIAFVTDNGPVAAGTFERVQSVVGDLMVPTDMYPPRYHVKGFPNEEQLRAIGNEPI